MVQVLFGLIQNSSGGIDVAKFIWGRSGWDEIPFPLGKRRGLSQGRFFRIR
jgi:hypothetical protein